MVREREIQVPGAVEDVSVDGHPEGARQVEAEVGGVPLMRIQLDSDRGTARRVVELHQADRVHRASREAARAEVWRRGRTPAGEPVFVGVSPGEPVRLLYDVEVYPDSTP